MDLKDEIYIYIHKKVGIIQLKAHSCVVCIALLGKMYCKLMNFVGLGCKWNDQILIVDNSLSEFRFLDLLNVFE